MSVATKKSSNLVPLADAAITLQVPYRAAYDMALSGRLGQPSRLGRSLLVPRDAVEAESRRLASLGTQPTLDP